MDVRQELTRASFAIILIVFLGCNIAISNGSSYFFPSSILLLNESQPMLDYEVKYANSTITIGNMKQDSIWEKVPVLEIPEFGHFGSMRLYYDQRYINGLLTFDNDIPWIAIQIMESSDADCMENNSDGWIFGQSVISEQGISYAGDTWFEGHRIPHNDFINDLSFELLISEDQPAIVEFRRFQATNDTSGYDVDFELGLIRHFFFASTVNHLGDRNPRVISISNSSLPDFFPSASLLDSPHEKNLEASVSSVFFGAVFLGLLLGTIILFDKRKMLE